jgi:hypothetical protein
MARSIINEFDPSPARPFGMGLNLVENVTNGLGNVEIRAFGATTDIIGFSDATMLQNGS